MRGLHRWGVALLVSACGTSGTMADGSSSGGSASDSSSGGTTSAATDSSGSSDSAGPTEAEGSSDGTTGPMTDTDDPAGLEAHVLLSSVAVLEVDDLGALSVECVATEGGVPIVGESFSVSVAPMGGVSEDQGVYTFTDAGIYDVTCSGAEVEATEHVAVLNEAIEPAMADIGLGMGQALHGIFAVLAADGRADDVLVAAVDTLDAALPALQSEAVTELDDVLREIPGDYPTPAELQGLGITANADDDQLGAALDGLDDALAAFEASVAALDPMVVDDPALEALEADMAGFEAAVEALSSLEPTAHGLLAQRSRVAELVRDRMEPTTRTTVQYLSDRIHAEADIAYASLEDPGGPVGFGLLGFTLGMFNQSHIRVQLVNQWYGDYIAQLDESINNFILNDAINFAFPPSPEGPEIEFLVASASAGFATPGYPSWIDGRNFDESEEFNLVLVFGDNWQGIVDAIISGCGIEESDSIPEAVVKFRDCIADINAAVDSLFWVPVSVGEGIYGSEQGLDMGEFPAACGGGLPTATFLLPMTYLGRGPSHFVNCI